MANAAIEILLGVDAAKQMLPQSRTFNGKITITNRGTGEHRTFEIKTQGPEAKFAPGERVVALLTGPNNERDYAGFGFFKERSGVIVWKKKRGAARPSSFDWFADMLNVLLGGFRSVYGKDWSAYLVQHETTCLVCNRTLTEPISIQTGIGPVCRGRA